MKNKITFFRIIKIIVGIVLSGSLFWDKISIYISSYIKSYTSWLILESAVLVIALYSLGSALNILSILKLLKQGPEKAFKLPKVKQALRFALFIIPLIVGIVYFKYNFTWRYTWNKFDNKTLGVLIADFREVILDEYLPQKKYSIYLKENLPQIKDSCKKEINIKYENTPAFFTSIDEAAKFGEKINARLVIWGEVYKSEGFIRIKPKLFTPGNLMIGTPYLFISNLVFKADYSETWNLTGSPLDLDTMTNYVNDILTIPSIFLYKDYPEYYKNYYGFIECAFKSENFVNPDVKLFLATELITNCNRKDDYEDSKYLAEGIMRFAGKRPHNRGVYGILCKRPVHVFSILPSKTMQK